MYLEGGNVVVGHELEAGHEGAEAFVAAGICGAGDGRHGPSPEVTVWPEEKGENGHQISTEQ